MAERQAATQFDDPINLQYTSGTTGFPKAATLSHHNILNNAYFVGRGCGYSEADRICIPVPFYHCFGMVMGNLAAIAIEALNHQLRKAIKTKRSFPSEEAAIQLIYLAIHNAVPSGPGLADGRKRCSRSRSDSETASPNDQQPLHTPQDALPSPRDSA